MSTDQRKLRNLTDRDVIEYGDKDSENGGNVSGVSHVPGSANSGMMTLFRKSLTQDDMR